jgi:signal transduction histidine kinase/HAMP domain-containing protein
MIRSPGLAARLGVGFGLILLTIFVMVALGFVLESRGRRLEEQLVVEIAPRSEAAHELQRAHFLQVLAFNAYLGKGEARYRNELAEASETFRTSLKHLRQHSRTAREAHLAEEIGGLYESFQAGLDEAMARVEAGSSLEERVTMLGGLYDLRNRLGSLLVETVHEADRQAGFLFGELRENHASAARATLGLGLLALSIGILAASWVIRPVRRQTGALLVATRALAAGDHGPARELARHDSRSRNDELGELARAFATMSERLESRERYLSAQDRLSRALAASHEVDRLAADALAAIAETVGCESGAVYLFDRDRTRLTRVAGYAAEGAAPELLPGEGLPGQAIAAGSPVVVRELPADVPFRLRLGLDDLPARTVAALPIGEGEALGAMVLAAVRDLPEEAFSFAEGACHQLAPSLENALAAREVARLAEALRAANAELEDRNAELQAQAEEIQAQNEELQAQGEEIAAQNEELQRQQQELLEADQAKDEFLAVASHEFKSPIAALKSFCQLLIRKVRARPEYADLLPMLERVDAQADKVVVRVNRLLDVSRAKMGTLTPAPERFDLVALCRSLVTQAQIRTDKHKLVLDTSVDRLVGRWDRLYLEQVIGNLLDNGIRYSPGGGEVRVEIREVNGEAHVAIHDQGIGMSDETKARLFQPYFRGEAARRVAADGMGIGLYVSREIVSLHGGRVTAESRPGEGSTFRIALPLVPPGAISAA